MHLFCWVYQLKASPPLPEDFLVHVFAIRACDKAALLFITISSTGGQIVSNCIKYSFNFLISPPTLVLLLFSEQGAPVLSHFTSSCNCTDSNCSYKYLACLQNPNSTNSAHTDTCMILSASVFLFFFFFLQLYFLRTQQSFFLFSLATSSRLLFFPPVHLVISSS